MNAYAAIIAVALVLEYLLGFLSAILNLRRSREGVPPELASCCTDSEKARAQAYLESRTRLDLAGDTVMLGGLAAFWVLGGFALADEIARSLFASPLLRGLLYIGGLALLRALAGLPLAAYGTFRVEERFGFNRTTLRTFLADRLKMLALAIVLGGSVLTAVLALFEVVGPGAWLLCWVAVSVFTIFVQFIAPVWLMPLFYRFEPLAEGDLRAALLDVAARSGFPVRRVFVIDGSRRSAHSNAFVAGFGRHRRIALFDTLIEDHPSDELVAVVAHEIGHWKRGHIVKGLVLGILHAGAVFFLLSRFLTADGLYAAFAVRPSVYAGLVFFGLLYTPMELLLSLAVNAFLRRNEYEADRFAATRSGGPGPMIRALRRLAASNLATLNPHPLTVWLEYSHPPVPARIRALCAGVWGEGDRSLPEAPDLRLAEADGTHPDKEPSQ